MIGQVLTELEIEGESCVQAVEAVEKVTAQPFQIVIIDWSSQPEAGFLLNTARERKPADRPLTLAIVSDDASVPTALQAGANSVLRKPLILNQVKDTLATARDLLRSKLDAPAHAAAAAAAASSAAANVMVPMEVQSTLHHGEFLQPSGSVPGAQFDTESSDVQKSLDHAAAAQIDPLKDLELISGPGVSQSHAAPTQFAAAAPAPAPEPEPAPDDEPRGLAWYLKSRAKSMPAEEAQPESPPPPDKAQLLGFDQTASFRQASSKENPDTQGEAAESAEPRSNSLSSALQNADSQQREETALFAYIAGEKKDAGKEPSVPRPWLKKLAIAAAVMVAASVAYFTVPQAVVRKDMKLAVGSAARAGHSWLNPQPAPTQPSPQAHESFGRAGDEYKLPVAENIPDANTDPSQIRVLPIVDPTVKPPANGTAGADPSAAPANAAAPASGDPAQTDPNQPGAGQVPGSHAASGQTTDGQTPQNQASQSPVAQNPISATAGQTAASPPQSSTTQAASAPTDPFRPNSSAAQPTGAAIPTPAVQTTQAAPVVQPAPVQPGTVRPLSSVSFPAANGSNASTPNLAGIPSSLKSGMAQMSPEASGNKPPEAALPSIEPVNLPEAAARGLLLEQATPVYPPSARGQSGTVTLQVLIGRDGTVEDAKFIQGSLVFARTAIDAVKQWRFKPYLMNGRPASTQTLLTLSFKPAS